jgi:hypothetical protein
MNLFQCSFEEPRENQKQEQLFPEQFYNNLHEPVVVYMLNHADFASAIDKKLK